MSLRFKWKRVNKTEFHERWICIPYEHNVEEDKWISLAHKACADVIVLCFNTSVVIRHNGNINLDRFKEFDREKIEKLIMDVLREVKFKWKGDNKNE